MRQVNPAHTRNFYGPETGYFVHSQTTAATAWVIRHNLGYFPSVTVVLSDGRVVEGDIQYISDSRIEITFKTPVTGKVHLT